MCQIVKTFNIMKSFRYLSALAAMGIKNIIVNVFCYFCFVLRFFLAKISSPYQNHLQIYLNLEIKKKKQTQNKIQIHNLK